MHKEFRNNFLKEHVQQVTYAALKVLIENHHFHFLRTASKETPIVFIYVPKAATGGVL